MVNEVGKDTINKVPVSKIKHEEDERAERNDKLKKVQVKSSSNAGSDEEDPGEESFEWETYLAKNDASPVPKPTFKHVISASTFDFESGMKLEVPNQDSSSTYWLATVIAKSGPLILLRYEGYQDDNSADFWCNSQSSEIHPVGWCAKTKHALRPPKAIQHKEKSWYDYLIKNLTGARKAAEHLFNKRQAPIDKLGVGMMLEVIDKEDPKYYWVAIISEIYAGRLRLQYKGTDDVTGEIWCYYLNERLFEPGHGYVYGLTLRPPRDFLKKISEKEWPNPKLEKHLITCWEKDLLKQLLKDRPTPEEHSFKIGMKLEAKDPVDSSDICCASVARVFDKFHFLVRIDNLLNSSVHEDRSFICHKKSHGIYPVGWCHKFNLPLNPPKGFNGHFTWKGYLQLEKAVAAPEEYFDLQPIEHDIKVGMKLEAVDQQTPANICVATVTQVLGRDMWVMFDGESRSEQIFDVRSFDIFPAGWCQMSGHELQWPRPSTMMQKNRISRLRSTTERKTRLDHLRKGNQKARKSIQATQNVDGPAQSSDNENPVPKRRKRNALKSKYYKGSKKRIVAKGSRTSSSEDEFGSADPTISYVFIKELANNLNTEEEIKRGFKLDENGRTPTNVITIDSDEEEDPDAKKRILNQDEINFFSALKVKPNELNQEQDEIFDKLLGFKLPLSERRDNAVNALFDRFRGHQSKSVARIRLIDFYRKQKMKQIRALQDKKNKRNMRFKTRQGLRRVLGVDTHTDTNNASNGVVQNEEPNKENFKAIGENEDSSLAQKGKYHVYRIVGQKISGQEINDMAVENITSNDAGESSVVSGTESYKSSNGLYRIVENSIVDKRQDNKIVMKIAKPVEIKESRLNGLTEHSLLLDGYSPARDIPAIDEHVTASCNKIRSSCKNLPQNPLSWTKHNVAEFIQAADCGKYARNFLEEEIDGHAFLLLTLNELHNLMGIALGPAIKLTDYIHTLQRDTNRTPKVVQVSQLNQVRSTSSQASLAPDAHAVTSSRTTRRLMAAPPQSSSNPPQITGVYRISRPQFAKLQQR